MTPSEWASAANKFSRANPGLTRAEIITKMNLQGMPRPTGVEGKGTDAKGNPRFGIKTRSKGQTARRKQHEQTSTEASSDNLEKLRQWQETINNMAAYAGMEGAHHEHYAPSDMTDMLAGEGAPGDYVDNRPQSYSRWKTAVEQYNRTKRHNRYRLVETPEGARIVDRRYADARVDPYDLPGMDIDESMDVEQVFSALPFMVAHDLSMRHTEFPGQTNLPGLTTTADGQVHFKMPALPGFDTSVQPGPSVTAPQGGGYYAPQVMEVNGNGTNGTNGTNGSTTPATIEPPINGNGGNGNGVDYTAQNAQQLAELGKTLTDASLYFRAGKAVLDVVKTASLLAGSYALK
jgi:hypothetical protein